MGKAYIEEDTLIDIADAIRSKTGITGLIDVPEFANMIRSIQSGDSLPGNTKVGLFIPTESVAFWEEEPIIIQHNLGITPNLFVMFDISNALNETQLGEITAAIYFGLQLKGGYETTNRIYRNNSSSGVNPMRGQTEGAIAMDSNKATIGIGITGKSSAIYSPWRVAPNHTYLWIANHTDPDPA